jgi:EAL domain-containing protein (putative c-di-GMP-specific phosphodiesterase class I)
VIVRSTIDLAHNLGLTVVAEGVEDERALDMLMEYGCDSAQGYFFSHPCTPDELTDWLTDSPFGTPVGAAG